MAFREFLKFFLQQIVVRAKSDIGLAIYFTSPFSFPAGKVNISLPGPIGFDETYQAFPQGLFGRRFDFHRNQLACLGGHDHKIDFRPGFSPPKLRRLDEIQFFQP